MCNHRLPSEIDSFPLINYHNRSNGIESKHFVPELDYTNVHDEHPIAFRSPRQPNRYFSNEFLTGILTNQNVCRYISMHP